MLSVIIPSRNEEAYLANTVRNVLLNAEEDIEILVVLDGWLPPEPITATCGENQSVTWIHNESPIGQRQSINKAARQAKGKYLMKLDAHCAVSKGFDRILKKYCQPLDTVIPRMYNLDIATWQPKKNKRTDYMYFGFKDGWLRSQYFEGEYKGRNKKKEPVYDETMGCMGPGYFMYMDRFWQLGGEDESHGGWGQQGIEWAAKSWLSGGRMMVCKECWFSHFFRGGGIPDTVYGSDIKPKKGFPYSISSRDVEKARKRSHELWLDGDWKKEPWASDRDIKWLVDKFNPPGWEDYFKEREMKYGAKEYYNHMIKKHRMPMWLGVKVVKYPGDIMLYQQEIFKNKPEIIVECGTYLGGSALFFATIYDLIYGNDYSVGKVLTIDITEKERPVHPRITYYTGRTTATDTLDDVKKFVGDKTVMVILDSNHHRRHVKRELMHYSNIVTPGQFLVVEDTNYSEIGKKDGPDEAVAWFLKKSKKLKREPVEKQFVFTLNPGGWLRRV